MSSQIKVERKTLPHLAETFPNLARDLHARGVYACLQIYSKHASSEAWEGIHGNIFHVFGSRALTSRYLKILEAPLE